jgi:signal transduction histidine kinase
MRARATSLRWRLLIALVLTSVATLGVAAAVLLEPLQERLRDQSTETLRSAVEEARPRFERVLNRRPSERDAALFGPAFELEERTDARVLVADGMDPEFFYDSAFGSSRDPQQLALRALRLRQTQVEIQGEELRVAVLLFGRRGQTGVLVAERRLTEVAAAVEQVRNALLAAAGVGLLVSVLLGVALSRTLLRRLDRLRATALRITREGPDAPRPRDERHDEVGDLARALARMQEELRRQEASRRAFVATASHELRTPITMLQGTLELLEEDLLDGHLDHDDAQRQVASARRELERLSTLAGELLDLSRLDAAVQLRSEPVELGEVVRAVAAEFDLRARERDVTVEVVPPTGPCWGRGDPDAVARVVRILIDNALRYGPDGQAVRVEATSAGPSAWVAVADAGPGVPQEERERIFERFHRGRGGGPAGGFGLGLAIGRELAERMGGSLRLAERPEHGACFVLTLPRAVPSPEPSPARDSVAAG